MYKTGPFVPCLITHGTIVSFTDDKNPKVMTGIEHLIAQGEPVGEAAKHSDFKSYIGDYIDTLSTPDQKLLAGNAYDASSFFFFALYVLSNVSMREETTSPSSASASAPMNVSLPSPPLDREVILIEEYPSAYDTCFNI